MMDTAEMLKVFSHHRGDAIVVPGRGGRHWVEISDKPQPRRAARRSGDGRARGVRDGARAGAAEAEGRAVRLRRRHPDEHGHPRHDRRAAAEELLPLHARQRVLRHDRRAAGAATRRRSHYHEVARACGYPRAYAFDNLETFAVNVERILGEPGPVFVALKVRPEIENKPIGSRVEVAQALAGPGGAGSQEGAGHRLARRQPALRLHPPVPASGRTPCAVRPAP